jgi:hypothetical protein
MKLFWNSRKKMMCGSDATVPPAIARS